MRLIAVEPGALADAMTSALRGDAVIAPLPTDPVERAAALAMLEPDRAVLESDAAAIVATSGSTGRPKGVVLSRAAITASAEATHERLGGPGDWLAALPGHYVAGFMVYARAAVAGTAVREIGTDLAGLGSAQSEARRPCYLSLVATQLRRALSDPATSVALAGLDAVLLGGGPAPTELVEQARAVGIRLVTTYGMSETCGGCVYDGVPLDGVEVTIGPVQTVELTGPMVFAGYRGAPELTADVLTETPTGRRFTTSDRGRWADGRLEILGRLDDVVISGGLNVDLAAVERAATGWATPLHARIAVLGVPDPEWGTSVVAVTDAPADVGSLADLRATVGASLPSHALPRRLVHRPTIPSTAGGKIDRHRLSVELSIALGHPSGSEDDQ